MYSCTDATKGKWITYSSASDSLYKLVCMYVCICEDVHACGSRLRVTVTLRVYYQHSSELYTISSVETCENTTSLYT